MTRLEKLLDEREKLEKEIASLEHVVCGCAGFHKRYEGYAVVVTPIGIKLSQACYVVAADTEKEVLERLSVVMEDLADLYTQLEKTPVMKTFHCIFDPTVMVSFQETVEREGNLKNLHYSGPRQIACTKAVNCAKCGWNPMVEEMRKANGMRLKRGYVSLDNIPADVTHEYWAYQK